MTPRSTRILVWDAPTRMFHWLLAFSFVVAFVTGDTERWRDVHVVLGYTMAALIGFRLVWGMVGTRYARFASFAFGPKRLLSYLVSLLRGTPEHHAGHNPAGGLAVFLLLALGGVVAASGLAAHQEFGGDWLEEMHEAASHAMLLLVLVHVAGVLASSVLHRENLVWAMVTGMKQGVPVEGISRRHAWLAMFLAAAVAAFWYSGAAIAGLSDEKCAAVFPELQSVPNGAITERVAVVIGAGSDNP